MKKTRNGKGTSIATRVRCICNLKQGFFGRAHELRTLNHKNNPHPFTATKEKNNPSESFGHTNELSRAVALRGGPSKCRMAKHHTRLVHKEFGRNRQARRQQFPTSVGENFPAGRSNSSHLVRVWQLGNIGNFLLGLGNLKSFLSELSRAEFQAHRLVGVGHAGKRAVIILILPYISARKLRPWSWCVLHKLNTVTKASNKPDTRVQSLSFRTAMLNNMSLKIAVGKIQSPVPSQMAKRERNKVGH